MLQDVSKANLLRAISDQLLGLAHKNKFTHTLLFFLTRPPSDAPPHPPHLPHIDWWPQLNSPLTHTPPTPSPSSSAPPTSWNHWCHFYGAFIHIYFDLTCQDPMKWEVYRQSLSTCGPALPRLPWFGLASDGRAKRGPAAARRLKLGLVLSDPPPPQYSPSRESLAF